MFICACHISLIGGKYKHDQATVLNEVKVDDEE